MACFDKLTVVSAVNRLVEETVSIGMLIPRRKVKGRREGRKGGREGYQYCMCEIVRADKQEEAETGRILLKEKYILPLCAASVSSEYFTSGKPRRRSV